MLTQSKVHQNQKSSSLNLVKKECMSIYEKTSWKRKAINKKEQVKV